MRQKQSPPIRSYFWRREGVRERDYTEKIEPLCRRIQRQPEYTDAEGYEQRIVAASIDEDKNRCAWVEVREKQQERYVDIDYYLNVMVDDRLLVRWTVETYNPFFGCYVELFYWMKSHLIFIYHEKHHTFACSFLVSYPLQEGLVTEPEVRHQIPDEWILQDETILYHSGKKGKVKGMSLPELRSLKT